MTLKRINVRQQPAPNEPIQVSLKLLDDEVGPYMELYNLLCGRAGRRVPHSDVLRHALFCALVAEGLIHTDDDDEEEGGDPIST